MNPETVNALFVNAVERGDVQGVAALVADRQGVTYRGEFGLRDATENFTADTVGWLGSATKVIVSVAALQLVELGELDLDAPASRVLPSLAGVEVLEGFDDGDCPRLRASRSDPTLRQLLSHTSGFSYATWNADVMRYHAIRDVPGVLSCQLAALESPLVSDPGARWEYGIGIDWVGRMIEHVVGRRLGDHLREAIFEPLGMRDTGFRLRPEHWQCLARMHVRREHGNLEPIEFLIEQEPEFEMGGGGLYGTPEDYTRFLRMLLRDGLSDGAPILRPETLAEARRNQIGALTISGLTAADRLKSNDVEFLPGVPKKWCLLGMRNTEPTASGRAAGSMFWAGLCNIYFWVDWVGERVGILYTQVLPFGDQRVLRLFDEFERMVSGQDRRRRGVRDVGGGSRGGS